MPDLESERVLESEKVADQSRSLTRKAREPRGEAAEHADEAERVRRARGARERTLDSRPPPAKQTESFTPGAGPHVELAPGCATPPVAPRPLSVLVVDDAADAANSTAAVLALRGFGVRVAGSGEEALRAVIDPPDVVLLDIRMPGMDGWELARRLRAAGDRAGKRPLLVAVTGCGAEDDRRRSAEAGIDLHLVKPVEPAVLVGLLRRFERVLAPGVGSDPDEGLKR